MKIKTQVNNRPELKKNRRRLRNHATPAERELWKYLKGRKLNGRKFRRQFSFYHFILDFYCPSEKLGIELDGAHHFTEEQQELDQERTEILEAEGIKVLRFENKQVFQDLNSVLTEIKENFQR